ncbi:MAG: CotH kinase family protein [Planctomycetes bacterium]|nr:CotH kinase family protein [Planctomycetota bacterium]
MKRLWTVLVLLAVIGCNDDGPRPIQDEVPAPGTPPPPPDADLAAFFDEERLHDVRLTLNPSDRDDFMNGPHGIFYPATFTWRDEVVERVGVATGDLPEEPKRTVIVRFDQYESNQTFRGLREVKLDAQLSDPSSMRDRLSMGMFRARMPAPRAVHARLFVNDEYRGLFSLEEVIDAPMLQRRFAGDVGFLYRMDYTGGDVYAWQGSELWRYVPFPFGPRTRVEEDHGHVVTLVDILTHDPGRLGDVFDVEALLELLAVDAAILNPHGLTGDSGPDNNYLYYRPETGRFTIFPWDLDATWNYVPTRSIFENFQAVRLAAPVENDPALRRRYKEKIAEILDGPMLPSNVHARIDFIYEQIRDAVYADPYKRYSSEDFDGYRDFMKNLATQRYENLRQQIAE